MMGNKKNYNNIIKYYLIKEKKQKQTIKFSDSIKKINNISSKDESKLHGQSAQSQLNARQYAGF